jgi:hypothetical protein
MFLALGDIAAPARMRDRYPGLYAIPGERACLTKVSSHTLLDNAFGLPAKNKNR